MVHGRADRIILNTPPQSSQQVQRAAKLKMFCAVVVFSENFGRFLIARHIAVREGVTITRHENLLLYFLI